MRVPQTKYCAYLKSTLTQTATNHNVNVLLLLCGKRLQFSFVNFIDRCEKTVLSVYISILKSCADSHKHKKLANYSTTAVLKTSSQHNLVTGRHLHFVVVVKLQSQNTSAKPNSKIVSSLSEILFEDQR